MNRTERVEELRRQRRIWLHLGRTEKVDEINDELRKLGDIPPPPVERR